MIKTDWPAYTLSQKTNFTFDHNFGKCRPIVKLVNRFRFTEVLMKIECIVLDTLYID